MQPIELDEDGVAEIEVIGAEDSDLLHLWSELRQFIPDVCRETAFWKTLAAMDWLTYDDVSPLVGRGWPEVDKVAGRMKKC